MTLQSRYRDTSTGFRIEDSVMNNDRNKIFISTLIYGDKTDSGDRKCNPRQQSAPAREHALGTHFLVFFSCLLCSFATQARESASAATRKNLGDRKCNPRQHIVPVRAHCFDCVLPVSAAQHKGRQDTEDRIDAWIVLGASVLFCGCNKCVEEYEYWMVYRVFIPETVLSRLCSQVFTVVNY